MRQYKSLIKDHVIKMFPQFSIARSRPAWFKAEHWKPDYLLINKESKDILAIDILLSGNIPQFQYSKIVHRLLEENENLRVVIVTLEESFEDNPDIEDYCLDSSLGLKIVIPGVGLQTIVRIDFDTDLETVALPLEDGWFPAAILEQAKDLTRLCFYKNINEFIDSVVRLGNDKDKTLELVCTTVDELLCFHPTFKKSIKHFMRLKHFEEILRLGDAESSDHFFHSFRVFLSGCAIINEFYDCFLRTHERYAVGGHPERIKVEYSWLLTAIFHDIGRSKEKEVIKKHIYSSFKQENCEITVQMEVEENMWTTDHYMTTKRVLGSIGAYVAQGDNGDSWDGGSFADEDAKTMVNEWINIYENFESHAIISAFDFFADITKKCEAANERGNRPFVLAHAAPAALAILLHDWKKWPEQRKLGLIPVNGQILPMAALLIYIDTWDDYKRRGETDPLTYIKSYNVDAGGACVRVEWGDSSRMEDGSLGYEAYQKELENLDFALNIEYGMAGTL